MPSIRDVAKKAGVGSERYQDAERQRLCIRRKPGKNIFNYGEMNYNPGNTPDIIRQENRSGGRIVPKSGHPFFAK